LAVPDVTSASILTDWLIAHSGLALLVFARTLGLAWTAPALSTSGLDMRFRIVLAILLALVLVPAIAGDVPVELGWQAGMTEVLVGAGIGWSASLVIAGARQAGEIVGAQAGLSAAALFDPEAGDDLTALGHLYGLVALGVFLALDGPLVLVRALVESYRVIPAGGASLSLTKEAARFAFERVGEALLLALRGAAPAAVALALAGMALGLLGKAAPSLQLMALAMPVRAALGMVMVVVSLATLVATLTLAWGGWPGSWTSLSLSPGGG
jgi:flagellar biosynthesis protein FliR